jgi:hypothetical protein
MIARDSGLGMGVGRFSSARRGVGVKTMPHAALDTTRRVAVRPGAGVVRLHVPAVAVGLFVDRGCVADGVEVTP